MLKAEVFYTYALINPNTGTPFYIGKGQRSRATDHLAEAFRPLTRGSNKHKINTIKKIVHGGKTVQIVKIDEGISEAQAFECEEFAISFFGRADRGLGPLTNLTNGGEGASGQDVSGEKNPNYGKRGEDSIWWGRKHTDETKSRMSAAQAGRVITDEHRANMRKPKSPEGRAAIAKARIDSAYRPSEETKQKLSAAMKGRPSPMRGRKHTDEFKAEVSNRMRGVPKKKTPCIHCGMLCAPNVLSRFHSDNCKEKATC